MATKELTGLVALGHMLVEEGAILAIRNESAGFWLDYEDVAAGKAFAGDLKAEGFELGWRCVKCEGSGEIAIRCKCASRSNYAQINNPCCDGWDSADCPDCDGGVRWEDQY